ncbi:MAG: hypothetical protein Q7T76_02630 [Ferruginibacter sp.]|nr:hypothetical protein [Ferruginibacter sp.]
MQLIFLLFVLLLIGAIAWAFIEHRKQKREDDAIFGEYLDNQRKLKFENRGRQLRSLKRRG